MLISSLNIVNPGTKSYLVILSFNDFIPHSLAFSGTLKSGSPTLRFNTSIPWPFISFTFELIPTVRDGVITSSLFDNILFITSNYCQNMYIKLEQIYIIKIKLYVKY